MALALAITMVFVALTLTAQEKPVAGPFTPEQSASGRKIYQGLCSTCHGPDLAGHNGTPPLTGKSLLKGWRDRSVQDLMGYIRTTMPPRSQGTLTGQTSAEVVAFLLESNGASAGSQPLTPATNVMIRAILPADRIY
jgi:mono/diheme cytochrome c family protein